MCMGAPTVDAAEGALADARAQLPRRCHGGFSPLPVALLSLVWVGWAGKRNGAG